MNFLVIIEDINVEMIKSQIEAKINNLYLRPYPNKGNKYENLIEKKWADNKKEKPFPLVTIKKDKRSHNIEIVLNKMHIFVINRYFEELIAFKNEIVAKFSDLRKQLISKVKNEKAQNENVKNYLIFK